MMKYFKNERGITLVELLATLVIGSLLLSIVVGVHVLVQKQYNNQKADIGYILDVTTVAKAITKDIRMAEVVDITANVIELTFVDGTTRKYELVGNKIQRGGGDYISDIADFQIYRVSNDPTDVNNYKKLILVIESVSGKNIETEIIIR